MDLVQGFCITKLKSAHYCVRRGEDCSFCGESEQHPKWDSVVKAAPKPFRDITS